MSDTQNSAQDAIPKTSASLKEVNPEIAKNYLEERLQPQLAWYERRAQTAKRWSVGLISTQLVMTTSIPVANTLAGNSTVASTILAALAALATGLQQMGKFHENWVRYRTAASSLDAIQLRYNLGLSPFDGDNRHSRLIAEGEGAMSQEGMQWSSALSARSNDDDAAKMKQHNIH